MRAGLKLCGRKPRHAPASTAAISVGELMRGDTRHLESGTTPDAPIGTQAESAGFSTR
jgi:hypothetical protein